MTEKLHAWLVKRVKVDVTVDDIKQGERGKARTCPVALAISRTAGAPYAVTGGHAWITDSSRSGKPLPELARRFVIDFDAWLVVAPISFDLEL